MAAIEEKIKNNKIISYKFKACLGRDENGKQIFKCSTWYPPAELTKAKRRKEAERAAAAWEAEVRQAYILQQQKDKEDKNSFGHFVNEVWLPLCVRDGSHRPATIAMYTNILKTLLPHFKDFPMREITGIQISQYLHWLRNDYRKQDGNPLSDKSIRHMESAYNATSRAMVLICWNVGKRIVEQEQNGHQRAEYGTATIFHRCGGETLRGFYALKRPCSPKNGMFFLCLHNFACAFCQKRL